MPPQGQRTAKIPCQEDRHLALLDSHASPACNEDLSGILLQTPVLDPTMVTIAVLIGSRGSAG